MTKLTLTNHVQENATLLENEFIDKYMPEANGEYVKVYLLLLRHLHNPSVSLDISKIADILDYTEKDVIRALNYWKKVGLLDYEAIASRKSVSEASAPDDVLSQESAPAEPKEQSNSSFKSRRELKELLFVAEQYLGKTLTLTDMNMITYFYDELGMSTDLIEYVIEYCVDNGHKSMHYIQKVALSWADQNIKTVSEAKASVSGYNKTYYSVLKAYGIKGRAPAAAEAAYIRRWTEEYGFSLKLILEACNRTMTAIHQPSFQYTESILKEWFEKGVRTWKDVQALDQEFQKERTSRKASTAKPAPKNKFNNFEGRTYEDMDDLTRKLIQT